MAQTTSPASSEQVVNTLNENLEQVVEIVSLLPELEPLCGLALAFNLAYLNLKMFRYREKLAKAARKTIGQLGGDDPNGHLAFSGFAWYWNACILAKHSDYPCGDKTPSLAMKNFQWHKRLSLWFDKKVDIWTCVTGCIIAGIVLVVGVAHKIGWWQSLNFLGAGLSLNILFGFLVLAMIAPTFFVWRGKMVVEHGRAYLKDQVDDQANRVFGDMADSLAEQTGAVATATP